MSVERILSLALPGRCAACRAWGSAPLCHGCEAAIRWIEPPVCDRCGRPVAPGAGLCRGCRGRTHPYERARSAAVYEGPAREALKAFKLLGERRAARTLAMGMTRPARELGGDAVTWVPGTRRSEVERGFVPAEELARPLARALGVPIRKLLAKVRETRDQSGLSRGDRRANLRGAFRARSAVPERVLLVDDIMTTGATAEACATALKAGGAREVLVVTFARAL